MNGMKKFLAIGLACTMTVSLAACGGGSSSGGGASDGGTDKKYVDVTLGEDTDLEASIKLLTNRTDMEADDYAGKNWASYIADFNEQYPNISVEVEGITDYAEDSLLRLQGGDDWGDIMMIPAVAKTDLSTYFLSYGSVDDVESEVNYINQWLYEGEVYGVPITANANGIVYNKKVFEEAGVTETPRTPEDFMDALQKIKDNTDAIPLYTNYAANWTLGAWDAYISGGATGDPAWQNDGLIHGKDPFADPGDGTHAYNVYKILYDAVAEGLTEDDYTTTDWEGSKPMINNGQIGCMVLGSWAFTQMQQAGDNADDIGYMPFPIMVGGKQYSSAGPDYCFGINANTDADRQLASLIFVKWMSEESNWSYNEGGLPIAADDTEVPEVYEEFAELDVVYVEDDPAIEGEEDLLNDLNADSELNINNGGNDKVAAIVENASMGTESYDDIMNEWNEKWSDAQEANGVEVQ